MSALYFCIIMCDYNISSSVHLVCPLSDVVLRSVDNCFLAVFTVCDCFVAGAVWEPPILGVPLQSHQLHNFPPVADLEE